MTETARQPFRYDGDGLPYTVLTVPIPDGTVLVEIPVKVSEREWVRGDTLVGEHAAGDPTVPARAGAELACRCGQTEQSKLWVRLGPRGKVLCDDCRSIVPPVVEGDAVAFRLSRSDLSGCVTDVDAGEMDQIQLRGTVERVTASHELIVRVDGWPVPHTVDVDALDERPGTRADMNDFWPDTAPEILDQAFEQIRTAGAFTVVSYRRDELGDDQ